MQNSLKLEHALDFKTGYDHFLPEPLNWQGNKLMLIGRPDLDMDAVRAELHREWVVLTISETAHNVLM